MFELINLANTKTGAQFGGSERLYDIVPLGAGFAAASKDSVRVLGVSAGTGGEPVLVEKSSWKAPAEVTALTADADRLCVGLASGKVVILGVGEKLVPVSELLMEGIVPEYPPTILDARRVGKYLLVAGGGDGAWVYEIGNTQKLIWGTRAVCSRWLYLVQIKGADYLYVVTWMLRDNHDQLINADSLVYPLAQSPSQTYVEPLRIRLPGPVMSVVGQGNVIWHLLANGQVARLDFSAGGAPLLATAKLPGEAAAFAVDQEGFLYSVNRRKDGLRKFKFEEGKENLVEQGKPMPLPPNEEWILASRLTVGQGMVGILWR
jgi:hypothetical protein